MQGHDPVIAGVVESKDNLIIVDEHRIEEGLCIWFFIKARLSRIPQDFLSAGEPSLVSALFMENRRFVMETYPGRLL